MVTIVDSLAKHYDKKIVVLNMKMLMCYHISPKKSSSRYCGRRTERLVKSGEFICVSMHKTLVNMLLGSKRLLNSGFTRTVSFVTSFTLTTCLWWMLIYQSLTNNRSEDYKTWPKPKRSNKWNVFPYWWRLAVTTVAQWTRLYSINFWRLMVTRNRPISAWLCLQGKHQLSENTDWSSSRRQVHRAKTSWCRAKCVL